MMSAAMEDTMIIDRARGAKAYALAAGVTNATNSEGAPSGAPKFGVPLSSRPGCLTDETGRVLRSKRDDPVAMSYMGRLAGRMPLVLGPQVLLVMALEEREHVVRNAAGQQVGSIIKPDIVIEESKFQGKVGLVVALGPLAYVDDPFRTFHYPWVLPGDWVVYPAYENSHGRFEFDGVTMATVPDETLKMITPAPQLVR